MSLSFLLFHIGLHNCSITVIMNERDAPNQNVRDEINILADVDKIKNSQSMLQAHVTKSLTFDAPVGEVSMDDLRRFCNEMVAKIAKIDKHAREIGQCTQFLRENSEKFMQNYGVLDHEDNPVIPETEGVENMESRLDFDLDKQLQARLAIKDLVEVCGKDRLLDLLRTELGVDVKEHHVAPASQPQKTSQSAISPMANSSVVPASIITAFKNYFPDAKEVTNWSPETVCQLIQQAHAQIKILQGESDESQELYNSQHQTRGVSLEGGTWTSFPISESYYRLKTTSEDPKFIPGRFGLGFGY
ncbi:hypothetical protein EAF04_004786 [Stromatinia cepivora]|nr:hypothetical protein EAF04_004786 [Stromatinia cepivora]